MPRFIPLTVTYQPPSSKPRLFNIALATTLQPSTVGTGTIVGFGSHFVEVQESAEQIMALAEENSHGQALHPEGDQKTGNRKRAG